MTISYIRPIVPDTTPEKASDASVRAIGQPLPLIAVPVARPPRLANVVCRMVVVDQRGRLADRHVTAALGWNAGTRLNIREHDGLLIITADPHGAFQPTKQGYLRLPADARRAAGVSCGDRVLLTAHLDRQIVCRSTRSPSRAANALPGRPAATSSSATPTAASDSSVRACSAAARELGAGPDCRSTTMWSTPSRVSASYIARPVGPPPATSTSVLLGGRRVLVSSVISRST
ncbi:MAG TPA: hypothetical protein VF330_01580 [Lentzea sp.]